MTTYPLSTLAPTISSAGISAPAYSDIYQSLIASFQQIYGADIYVAPDSQDGQWLAILASAINDSNQAAINIFNSFSPSYAQGSQLSSLVKINGLSRNVATYSTATGTVVGTAGTIITNGVVADNNGNNWSLPASVVIPAGGAISVTVTCQTIGAIAANIGSITQIVNPQLGWQSFSNSSAAVLGSPVETDAALRARQAVSTAAPSLSIIEAITAAVGNVKGVSRFYVFENDTGATDANGLPPHSISVVVYGGTTTDVASAIQSRKAPGVTTYGSTSVTVFDSYGLPVVINFYVLTLVPIYVSITGTALTGYVSTTATLIQEALVQYLNNLSIGEDVYYSRLFSPVNLTGDSAITATGLTQPALDALSNTYNITSIKVGTSPSPTGTSDLVIPFNEAAQGILANISVTIA